MLHVVLVDPQSSLDELLARVANEPIAEAHCTELVSVVADEPLGHSEAVGGLRGSQEPGRAGLRIRNVCSCVKEE